MIDIHDHVLYGLDDGAEDLETSLAMAQAAIDTGITHLVCTPHANDHFNFDPEVNARKLMELQEQIGDRLRLGLGCDFHLSYDNIQDQIRHPLKYSINGKQYLLVEFPDMVIPPQMTDALHNMYMNGVVPIITHPERNFTLSSHPDRMVPWMAGGCLVQVTAASLLGRFGKRAEGVAHDLIDRNWVNFIASDAHNLTSRPVALGEAYAHVAKIYGQDTADRLCIHNPRAAFYGEPMPPQPELLGMDEETRSKGFLARLFDF